MGGRPRRLPQRRTVWALTRLSRHASSAAAATARSWIARPVESNSVTDSGPGRPGSSREYGAELAHPVAADEAGLDRPGQLAAV